VLIYFILAHVKVFGHLTVFENLLSLANPEAHLLPCALRIYNLIDICIIIVSLVNYRRLFARNYGQESRMEH